MSRDPRVDPRPGDVLRGPALDTEVMVVTIVQSVTAHAVTAIYVYPDDDEVSAWETSLSDWRRDMASDTILHTAENADG